MTPTAEIFHGDPVPLPGVETFAQDSDRGEAARAARRTTELLAEHAEETCRPALAEAFAQLAQGTGNGPRSQTATAPPGFHAENFAINQKVEAFMAANPDADISTAIREVTEGPPKGVDADREAMNRRVNDYLGQHPEASIGDAIAAVSGAAT
jgi:hypothetical protein